MTHGNEEGRGILGGVVAQEIEIVIIGGVRKTAHMTEIIGDIIADLAHEREDATDQDHLNEEEDTGTSDAWFLVAFINVSLLISRSRS